ncbi:NAD(P)-dependent oxidoreductase [Schumannella sp. 10F1B-5-1]|uniref:NAD(P)-dependent oxidoreductase n=1 Tax=Schumannella sp. 10F1B-5-1 TaxID=2590780 RepID=UPI001C644481|nr:NAD(P)-dependent oxidoreductase [Schumannella sp. 10F1B-5-1]
MTTTIGFIGLGVMGRPMAHNLLRAGRDLVVWNRSPEATDELRAAGAVVADDVDGVFAAASTVIVMLVDEAVTDAVLGRGTASFAARAAGHLIVSTGSTSPDYARGLAADVAAAGGRFVAAPVSGSRIPAERGELVALLGGAPDDRAAARELLAPLCRELLDCGEVGGGLLMKLAVNLYLDVSIAALAEAVNLAARAGLDLDVFDAAVQSGQLASTVTRVKVPKLVSRDFAAQATARDALTNTGLIADAARAAGAATPLLDASAALYAEAVALGAGRDDMSAVLRAIEERSG